MKHIQNEQIANAETTLAKSTGTTLKIDRDHLRETTHEANLLGWSLILKMGGL